jgi:hypothetical protein
LSVWDNLNEGATLWKKTARQAHNDLMSLEALSEGRDRLMKTWIKNGTKIIMIAMLLIPTFFGLPKVNALGNITEITLEVDGFNAAFKNGIYINGAQVYLNSSTIFDNTTLRVPIASNQLVNGVNTVTVTSGNATSPTGTAGNNDDFYFRNVQLMIPEGTIYQAESAKVFHANGTTVTTTPSKTDSIFLGDGNFNDANAKEKAEFKFTLGSAQFIMEVNGMSAGLYNGLFFNGVTLRTFHETIGNYTTVTVNVPNRLIMKGNNIFTLTAGNGTSATGTSGNNDDYSVRNVSLKLDDNKILRMTSAKFYIGDGSTTTIQSPTDTQLLTLGDGNAVDITAKNKVDFTFNLVDYDFTFAMLPDTQNYTKSANTTIQGIFGGQTKWLVDKREEKNIQYVLSVGDIVNNWDNDAQWAIANAAYAKLDNANLPYGVVAGNHDVDQTVTPYGYSKFDSNFGISRYSAKAWYGGGKDGANHDHYDLITAGGKNFIILYLGWGLGQADFDWANSILALYPTRNAIISTHSYVNPTLGGAYGTNGQAIWDHVVSQNSNVFLVVSGHSEGTYINVKTNGSQQVVELAADYQFEPEAGAGYMKLLHFKTSTNEMIIDSYSPYKGDYNFYSTEAETRLSVTLQ